MADPATRAVSPEALACRECSGMLGGIVVRIPRRRAKCSDKRTANGCHSVSDGSLLLAQSVNNGAYSYQLVANGPAPTPMTLGTNATWVALYPDGSAFLSMSSIIDVARAGFFGATPCDQCRFVRYQERYAAHEHRHSNRTLMLLSPDGTYLVFNDYAIGEAHGID